MDESSPAFLHRRGIGSEDGTMAPYEAGSRRTSSHDKGDWKKT